MNSQEKEPKRVQTNRKRNKTVPNLEKALKRSGMSIHDFAQELNYSTRTIRYWISGERGVDEITLTRIADILSVSKEYLTGDSIVPTCNIESLIEVMNQNYIDRHRYTFKFIEELGFRMKAVTEEMTDGRTVSSAYIQTDDDSCSYINIELLDLLIRNIRSHAKTEFNNYLNSPKAVKDNIEHRRLIKSDERKVIIHKSDGTTEEFTEKLPSVMDDK